MLLLINKYSFYLKTNMKTNKIFSLSLALILSLQNTLPAIAQEIPSPSSQEVSPKKLVSKKNYKEGEVIIKYKKNRINLENNLGKSKAKNLESSKNLQELKSLNKLNVKILKTEKSIAEIIEELKNDPNIESVQPNFIKTLASVPNDPSFSTNQWGLQNTGQTINSVVGTNDADIDAPEAWDIENSENSEIVVAVIDTGARLTHEDLTANIWTNTDEIPDNGFDDDNNGFIDDVHGWDFEGGDNDPSDTLFEVCYEYDQDGQTCTDLQDVSGHGTFISGIIAAIHNNNKGISGISSKNKIKVMPLRFDLYTDTELEAINYAQANGAIIINASYGSSIPDSAEEAAINSFPGLFVAAAGNSGTNNDLSHYYPSDYTLANIISVAATDQNDALSVYSQGGSNYGNVSVDLAAPGKNIYSTDKASDTAYLFGNGTSFAAPYVAASAAMLFSANTNLSSASIKSKLLSSGDTLSSLSGKTVSGKRLNLNSALQSALKVETPSSNPASGTFSSAQTISLSSGTPGASIYYTLNGSTPSVSSTLYSSPISISSTKIIKAIAIKSGMTDSEIFSATFTINIPAPTPVPATPTIEQLKAADYDFYHKYEGYLKYQKYKDYQKYKKAKDKYGFEDSEEKAKAKIAYNNYKLFLKNPVQHRQYISLYDQYKKYKKYHSNVSPLSQYSKYSRYSKYSSYKNYGGSEYEAAYERYLNY